MLGGSRLQKTVTVAALAGCLLAITSGAFAAGKYLITSSAQVKPGSISYASLSADAKRRLAGKPGPAGPAGVDGTNVLARASGIIAWTADPALILVGAVDSSGSVHGASVALLQGQVIKSLAELVESSGAGMTHGMFAIYDANLKLVAQTADTPAAFQVTNQWADLPLTTPYTVPASGRYYFADLLAASSTNPSIGTISAFGATSGRELLPGGVPRGIGAVGPFDAFPTTLTNVGTGVTRSILAR